MATKNHFALKESKDYWRKVQADFGSYLIDGYNYFQDLARCASRAQYEIIIVGWDFDIRIDFPSFKDDSATSHTLGDFLQKLTFKNSSLQIYILIWDAAPFYAAGRQQSSEIIRFFQQNEQIKFHLDSSHPFSASQHQKIVVLDRHIAYCGGIDLTAGRLNSQNHDEDETKSNGSSYPAFHDLMIRVHGDAAAALAQIANSRWEKATKQDLFRRQFHVSKNTMDHTHFDFQNAQCLISRTMPQYGEQIEIREIESLYIKLIHNAKHLIYIENQYFASKIITDAIARSLKKKKGPVIIILLTPHHEGWFEDRTMGALRNKLINLLYEADIHKRLGVFFPYVPSASHGFTLHSKILIIDNHFAVVGSANLNNRSMGLDSECNISLIGNDSQSKSAIKMLLMRLLSEHLNMSLDEISENLKNCRDLLSIIRRRRKRAHKSRCLKGYHTKANDWIRDLLMDIAIFDLPRPLAAEIEFNQIIISIWKYNLKRKPKLVQTISIIVSTIILLSFITYRQDEEIYLLIQQQHPMVTTLLYSFLVFFGLVSSLLLIPLLHQIIFLSILFSGLKAYLLSLMLVAYSSMISYIVGHYIGSQRLSTLLFQNMEYLAARLGKGGILPIIYTRLIVWFPFTLINLIAGAANIGIPRFFVGSMIGTLPSVLLIVAATHLIMIFISDFSISALLGINLCVIISVTWIYLLKRRFDALSIHPKEKDIQRDQ